MNQTVIGNNELMITFQDTTFEPGSVAAGAMTHLRDGRRDGKNYLIGKLYLNSDYMNGASNDVNFKYAIGNIQYLFAYFIQYAIFRSWLFLILIILYFLIFQKFNERKYILFKIFFVVIASGLYAKNFYMDDYSLTIGGFKKLKLFYTCLLSTIPLISISEWHRKS